MVFGGFEAGRFDDDWDKKNKKKKKKELKDKKTEILKKMVEEQIDNFTRWNLRQQGLGEFVDLADILEQGKKEKLARMNALDKLIESVKRQIKSAKSVRRRQQLLEFLKTLEADRADMDEVNEQGYDMSLMKILRDLAKKWRK